MNKFTNKRIKNSIFLLTTLLLSICSLVGCGNAKNDGDLPKENAENQSVSKENVQETLMSGDISIGIGTANRTQLVGLNEEQLLVAEYFGDNYTDIYVNYDVLQRYPTQLKGTKLSFSGEVNKILDKNDDYYTVLVTIRMGEAQFFYRSFYETEDYDNYCEENKDNTVIVKVKESESQLVTGDYVKFWALYEDNNNYVVDGITSVYPIFLSEHEVIYAEDDWDIPEIYSIKDIKKIATAIFGSGIEVRKPSEEDYSNFTQFSDKWRVLENSPYYVVELENQTNSKFTKYYFISNNGLILDAKSNNDESINRILRITPDLQHYILFTYNGDLSTLSIDYYDRDLNKIWNREFENTESANYDFTNSMIFVNVDNNIHFINLADGTDSIDACRSGRVDRVCKVPDGVIALTAELQADAIMKINMDGTIAWSISLDTAIRYVGSCQIVGENFVIYSSNGVSNRVIVVNMSTGEIISDTSD